MAEVLGLGYALTGAIVAALITVIAFAWRLRLNPVLSFWIIYILTRPRGASAVTTSPRRPARAASAP